jgi:hypothetical protein
MFATSVEVGIRVAAAVTVGGAVAVSDRRTTIGVTPGGAVGVSAPSSVAGALGSPTFELPQLLTTKTKGRSSEIAIRI